MQLLPVYTGFIMKALLGCLMHTAGQGCSQEKFAIEVYMKNGSLCKRLRQMICSNNKNKCIKQQFTVVFADPNVVCTIPKNTNNINVTCSSQSGSNTTTCNGTRFQIPVDCFVRVNCLAKKISIACNTIPRPQKASTPSTTTSATTTVTSSNEKTPSTTTSATTTVTSSNEKTPSTTTSATTNVTSSSESTTTIASTTSISTDTSNLSTTTSVGILASFSSETLSQASAASNTATLVGGVVGGVLVGVVITVVVVVVWWKCRRRSEIKDERKRESHIYTGLAPMGNSDHGAPTTVPDVIKMSQAGRDTSPLPDFRSENQGETSGQDICSQGDYTYIKEVELEEDGGYSLGKGFPNTVSSKDLGKSGIDSGSGQITDTYNRLGAHVVTSTPQIETYNRIGDEKKDDKIIKDNDEMHPSSDYFVHESSPDQEDTYNRLTAGDEPRSQQHNSTYNRIGETDVEHREGMDQELTSPDCLILEKADIPGTQDDYNRLGYVSSETPSSNLKNTYNRIGDISTEEEGSGPSPDYFILEKNDGQGN